MRSEGWGSGWGDHNYSENFKTKTNPIWKETLVRQMDAGWAVETALGRNYTRKQQPKKLHSAWRPSNPITDGRLETPSSAELESKGQLLKVTVTKFACFIIAGVSGISLSVGSEWMRDTGETLVNYQSLGFDASSCLPALIWTLCSPQSALSGFPDGTGTAVDFGARVANSTMKTTVKITKTTSKIARRQITPRFDRPK